MPEHICGEYGRRERKARSIFDFLSIICFIPTVRPVPSNDFLLKSYYDASRILSSRSLSLCYRRKVAADHHQNGQSSNSSFVSTCRRYVDAHTPTHRTWMEQFGCESLPHHVSVMLKHWRWPKCISRQENRSERRKEITLQERRISSTTWTKVVRLCTLVAVALLRTVSSHCTFNSTFSQSARPPRVGRRRSTQS